MVTKEQVLAAMQEGRVEVIYSHGAFDLYGRAVRIGERAYRFDRSENFARSVQSYLEKHSSEEIADKIVEAIMNLDNKDREYCEQEFAG